MVKHTLADWLAAGEMKVKTSTGALEDEKEGLPS
jgi:hypothetical protein